MPNVVESKVPTIAYTVNIETKIERQSLPQIKLVANEPLLKFGVNATSIITYSARFQGHNSLDFGFGH